MLRRLALAAGLWACFTGTGWGQEKELAGPPPFPPAFASRPWSPVLLPPNGAAACGCGVDNRPCWQRLLHWLTYRPLPTQCRGGYFCSSCCGGGGSACGCRRPAPCCSPLLYTFFLDMCPSCAPPAGAGPTRPPKFPEPGDPPFPDAPHDVLPAH